MAPALASIEHAWPDHELLVRVTTFDPLWVPVRNLQRSVDFYGRLFGLRLVSQGPPSKEPGVLMSGAGRAWLALRDLKAHGGSRLAPVTIVASVASLVAAREVIWDLGIPAARDMAEVEDSVHGTHPESFVILDPDGHEIEFIETNTWQN